MKFIFPRAVIRKITTTNDKGLKIILETPEMSSSDMAQLFTVHQQESEITLDEPVMEKDDKSPSQRLRARMFIYYKETKGKKDGFSAWYVDEISRIGDAYLDKVN
jgi:hypothetical protein